MSESLKAGYVRKEFLDYFVEIDRSVDHVEGDVYRSRATGRRFDWRTAFSVMLDHDTRPPVRDGYFTFGIFIRPEGVHDDVELLLTFGLGRPGASEDLTW